MRWPKTRIATEAAQERESPVVEQAVR